MAAWKNTIRHWAFFLACASFSAVTSAETFTVDLTSNAHLDSTDAVWNIETGEIHPPIFVNEIDDGINPKFDRDLDVGDGRHGAFELSTYADFSENGDISGNIIRLNTDTFSNLQFTSFNLEAGWTLRPTGSNPLIIRSLGAVTIAGTIDCSGGNGQSGTNNEADITVGGQGRCGGGRGGNGGSSTLQPSDGSSGGSNVTGGGAGPDFVAVGGPGGGGGGAYSQPGTPATDGVNPNGGAVGSAGDNFQDDAFTITGGGSGGGGGSFVTGDSSGASGGAGGGSIHIFAHGTINITAAGEVDARGGDGGAVANPLLAGAGGGGGGGSLAMFSVGDIIIDSNIVNSENGTGGTANSGGTGGNGGEGRTWVVEKDEFAGGAFVETPVTLLLSPGFVRYKTGTFVTTTKEIDLQSSAPVLNSVTVGKSEPAGGSVTVEIASSSQSGFDPSGSFTDVEDLAGRKIERFVRLRITLENTEGDPDVSDPAKLTSLAIDYSPFRQTQFDFTSSGCGRISTARFWPQGLFLFLPLLTLLILRRPRRLKAKQ